MSDDLDDLKAAMRAATPAPQAAIKAADIVLARKNFVEHQGMEDRARQTSERSKTGLIRGVKTMIMQMNTRGGLAATTALVALCLIAVVPDWQSAPRLNGPQPVALEADVTFTSELEVEPDVMSTPALQKSRSSDALIQGHAAATSALDELSTAQVGSRRAVTTLHPVDQEYIQPEANTEAFLDADANSLKVTIEDPVSTFSIDVDTASYAVVRSSLMAGQVPPKAAVRIEEMINYFPYDYAAPRGDVPFEPSVKVVDTPWNVDTRLVHIAIQGENKTLAERPPLNLVLLIDTSGSMNSSAKLPLLKQSLALMLPELTERDSVAIVAYAGSAGQVLEPTPATDRTRILAALERLDAGGSTAGQAGLQQAYALAESMAEEGDVSRILLATDGDFNVGLSDPDALKDFISNKRKSGTYLSVLGFGRGNLDDATMQALAQNGNGQAAYIDTLSEAQKVLVDQFSGALYPIANDVKIQVEFNPAAVAEYRLIGYETRALRREDFNNDAVDAGDINAGHQVTALYEITPVDSPARLTNALRYGEVSASDVSDELGFLKLRYKQPGVEESALIELPIVQVVQPDAEAEFAIAIAGFGQLLQGGAYLGDWSYQDAIALATDARGQDPFGYRSEAVQLMRLAESLQR